MIMPSKSTVLTKTDKFKEKYLKMLQKKGGYNKVVEIYKTGMRLNEEWDGMLEALDEYLQPVKKKYYELLLKSDTKKELWQILANKTFETSYTEDMSILLNEIMWTFLNNEINEKKAKETLNILSHFRHCQGLAIIDDFDGSTQLMRTFTYLYEGGYSPKIPELEEIEKKLPKFRELLIDAELFDINQKSSFGINALMQASLSYPKIEEIQMLIKYGANPNTFDNDGFSALSHCLRPVIERNFYILNDDEIRPILYRKIYNIVRFLIKEGGANVNLQNQRGETLLMQYAMVPEIVEMLLSFGADPTIKDNEGMTAFWHIIKYFLHCGGSSWKMTYQDLKKSFETLFYAGAVIEPSEKEKLSIIDQLSYRLTPEEQVNFIEFLIQKKYVFNTELLEQLINCSRQENENLLINLSKKFLSQIQPDIKLFSLLYNTIVHKQYAWQDMLLENVIGWNLEEEDILHFFNSLLQEEDTEIIQQFLDLPLKGYNSKIKNNKYRLRAFLKLAKHHERTKEIKEIIDLLKQMIKEP